MEAPPHNPPREATMLKVAITLAVLGLLFAFLIPPMEGFRMERARRITCLNNLKQLGIALSLYAEEFGERCPVDSETPTLIASLRLLGDRMSAMKTLICPSDWRPNIRPVGRWSEVTSTNLSYSYVPDRRWKSSNSNEIVMLDRIYATKAGSPWPDNGNHGAEGGNTLFNDGRVEFLATLPTDLTDRNGNHIVLSP